MVSALRVRFVVTWSRSRTKAYQRIRSEQDKSVEGPKPDADRQPTSGAPDDKTKRALQHFQDGDGLRQHAQRCITCNHGRHTEGEVAASSKLATVMIWRLWLGPVLKHHETASSHVPATIRWNLDTIPRKKKK